MCILADSTDIFISGINEINNSDPIDNIFIFITGFNSAGSGLDTIEDCFASGKNGIFN
jgi:hypothetical protein